MEADKKTGIPSAYDNPSLDGDAFTQRQTASETSRPTSNPTQTPSSGPTTQFGNQAPMFQPQQVPLGTYGATAQNQPGQPSIATHPPLYAPPNQTYFVATAPDSLGSLQSMIPIMPMWAAITLCAVNCIMPGFGTMVAAMTVCCCADMKHQPHSSPTGLFCINFVIGWVQLFSVCIFLVGWAWSIMWGVLFIRVSGELYGKPAGTTTIIQQSTTLPVR